MKVKYIGKTNNNFTHSKIYEVIRLDEDGDYILKDDFMDEIQEYKSKFQIVDE